MRSHDAGYQLKKIREKLGLTQEAIQAASLEIARIEGNPQYAIRHSHLSVIENANSVPNIYKLFSLCAIYRLDLADVLEWYGLEHEMTAKFRKLARVNKTHRLTLNHALSRNGKTRPVPAQLDPGFDPRTTSFLSRMVKTWKEVPVGLLTQLDLKRHAYFSLGLDDFMMFPMIKPGSLVQVDVKRNTISREGWRSEFDRPVYLLELRDRYACCWCSLVKDRLHLVPHPLSPCKPETVPYPQGVDVVGQVVGVTMRLSKNERKR
ncbi:MAG: helix-turn-helix domain-containing protein [Acidobacteriia bacterium]|nr:helix-turn-helix domain-containing protein [Terriglobia bacterium]